MWPLSQSCDSASTGARAHPHARRACMNVWTVTGTIVPALKKFDDAVQAMMSQHDVRAASLAITKDGRLVHARGYTWADASYPITQPDTQSRFASCSKLFTSIAVHQLVENKKIALTD